MITQQQFNDILFDETKEVTGNITWTHDTNHSPAQEFRAEVNSSLKYSLFIQGRYNPFAGKLSFAFILRGTGRIYGLDLGTDHRNPDGEKVGEKHKNYWRNGARDKWAYVPSDITAPWSCPVEAWREFCAEAKLHHSGIMHPPAVQGLLSL